MRRTIALSVSVIILATINIKQELQIRELNDRIESLTELTVDTKFDVHKNTARLKIITGEQ